MTELLVLEKLNPVEIFRENGIDNILEKIKEEVSSEVPDLSTDKGRKAIASQAYKVSQSKTYLDNKGKELADALNAQLKPINAERKKARDFLDNLRDEIRKPLTDWEEEQKARAAELEEKVGFFKRSCTLETESGRTKISSDLELALCAVKAVEIDDSFAEFKARAYEEKEKAVKWLEVKIQERKKYEDEQAELERLRVEAEEKARKDEQERIAREAEERARREAEEKARIEQERIESERKAAEQAMLEAEERAKEQERLRIAAEERAKIEAEQAVIRQKEAEERARQEEVERQEKQRLAEIAEQEKREANKRHVSSVRKAAKEAIMSLGADEDMAKKIVLAINEGSIPNVSISY